MLCFYFVSFDAMSPSFLFHPKEQMDKWSESTLIVVTHGLTMRLILMQVQQHNAACTRHLSCVDTTDVMCSLCPFLLLLLCPSLSLFHLNPYCA